MASTLVTEVPATLFPTLTAEQLARITPKGRARSMKADETLREAGDTRARTFVVTKGRIELLWPSPQGWSSVRVLGPGQFSGEVGTLAGRPTLVQIRAVEDGEVIEVDREHLLAIVQNDFALSEIVMGAFLLRHLTMVQREIGDAVLVGSSHCAGTLRIREFLTRNNHPYSMIDLDEDKDVQELLDRLEITLKDIPVLICRGKTVLRNPGNQEIADCLGFNPDFDQTITRDLVIIGAGPSGLAAAVYGASEGLDVVVLEASGPGGQAGSSSKIENYLGFPAGISGQELTASAHAQAQKFGAQVMVAKAASRFNCTQRPYRIRIGDREEVSARAVIIASGAEYRKLTIENVERFEGAGIYYSATAMEAKLCRGQKVVVVGGGNSAGQAAVFLAEVALEVHVLVRGDTLSESMSRYLINRLEQHPRIHLQLGTEIVRLEGERNLEEVIWRHRRRGAIEVHPIRHLFVMAGAVPNTRWLDGCVVLDGAGFIKTGSDLTLEDRETAAWPLARPPHLLETSRPGVFAVGDVRSGNLKRVASAVGEGAMAVSLVHRVLRE
jgi:thioredoxin reductase (NADPH)